MYVGYGWNPALVSGTGTGTSPTEWYQFNVGRASIVFDVRGVRSDYNNRRIYNVMDLKVSGELHCDDGDMDDQISDFIDAFASDYKTLALYRDDDTMTRHTLDIDDPTLVDGPWVHARTWPRGDRGEYATQRTFMVHGRAIFDANTNPILRYHESVQTVGQGARYAALYDQDGNFIRPQVVPNSVVQITQSGYSIGWQGYVFPLGSVEPTYLDADRTVLVAETGRTGRADTMEYAYRWRYHMSAPTLSAYAPTIR